MPVVLVNKATKYEATFKSKYNRTPECIVALVLVPIATRLYWSTPVLRMMQFTGSLIDLYD
jgi:hypothetical protein